MASLWRGTHFLGIRKMAWTLLTISILTLLARNLHISVAHMNLDTKSFPDKPIDPETLSASSSNSHASKKEAINPLPPQRGKISLLHIGKTGGETLRRHIFAQSCLYIGNETERNECLDTIGEPSELSMRTRGICHFKKEWPSHRYTQRAAHYLFTTREPLARFESWYRFSNPLNCDPQKNNRVDACKIRQRIGIRGPDSFSSKFWKCFPNIIIMAEALNPSFKTSLGEWNRTDCLALLKYSFETVDGNGDLFHLTANYRHYIQVADIFRPNKTTWAIRLENQWDDAEQVDLAFGGEGNFTRHRKARYSHGSEDLFDTRNLYGNTDKETILRVCCALWPDMMAYATILDRARNLRDRDRLETYQLTWEKCGQNLHSWDDLKDLCSRIQSTVKFF